LDGPAITIEGIDEIRSGNLRLRVILSDEEGNILEERIRNGGGPIMTLGEDLDMQQKTDLFQVHILTMSKHQDDYFVDIFSTLDLMHGTTLTIPNMDYSGGASASHRVDIELRNDTKNLEDYSWYLSNLEEKYFYGGVIREPGPAILNSSGHLPEGNNSVFSFLTDRQNPSDYYWAFWDSITSPSENIFTIEEFQRKEQQERLFLENSDNLPGWIDIHGELGPGRLHLYYSEFSEGNKEPGFFLPDMAFDSYTSTIGRSDFEDGNRIRHAVTRKETSFSPNVRFQEDLVTNVSAKIDGYTYTGHNNIDGIEAQLLGTSNGHRFTWTILSPGVASEERIFLPPLLNHLDLEFGWGVDIPARLQTLNAYNTSETNSYEEFQPYFWEKRYGKPTYDIGYREEVVQVDVR
jgi:hypothetical protein